jgi:hypothetical protein
MSANLQSHRAQVLARWQFSYASPTAAARVQQRRARALVWIALAGMLGLAACTHQARQAQADADWYFLKEATNGRNMTLASWRMCQADPGCSPTERAELEQARVRTEADYQRARVKVDADHARGWYADVNAMPAFARDPSLGLDP